MQDPPELFLRDPYPVVFHGNIQILLIADDRDPQLQRLLAFMPCLMLFSTIGSISSGRIGMLSSASI